MRRRVLVTGGAGFIGNHLLHRLAKTDCDLIVFDNLHPQVHGSGAVCGALPVGTVFIQADIRDQDAVARAVAETDPDYVIHLAAETGTGQSWDEVHRYCDVNVGGTASLVEALRRLPEREGRRLVLASSRAVYGEGAYQKADGSLVVPQGRQPENMRRGLFDPMMAGLALRAVPTPEDLPTAPASIYASTKLMQEFVVTQALLGTSIESVVLRFQNVYGPGQSLNNAYTGVLSIFSGQILKGQALNIYEDGQITRDFVYVEDVVDALMQSLMVPNRLGHPINIGSGKPTTILSAARELAAVLDAPDTEIRVTGDFRAGDVRHAVADIRTAKAILNWTPRTDLREGLTRLADWVRSTRGA